jgi:hypothetical protein
MDKATKVFLNSLKCPLCKGQVDMFDSNVHRPSGKYNYACATDYNHYTILINDLYYGTIKLSEEIVKIYHDKYLYTIIQFRQIKEKTSILIYNTDAENRIIEKQIPKIFNYSKLLFDFQKTNKENILNRVKTILVFQ